MYIYMYLYLNIAIVLFKKIVYCLIYLQLLKSCQSLGNNSIFKVHKNIRTRLGMTVATE